MTALVVTGALIAMVGFCLGASYGYWKGRGN